MRMRALTEVILAVAVGGLMMSCNSKNLRPGYCKTQADCMSGMTCDTRDGGGTFTCVGDGGIGGMGGIGGKTDGGGGGGSGGHPFHCDASVQCGDHDAAAPVCETDAAICVGCVEDTDCKDTANPICGPTHSCVPCKASPNQCATHIGKTVCAAGTCVECVVSSDCTAVGTKPICDTNVCRKCQADAECVSGPGVCMTDGHCATAGEVLYVQFNAGGCPTPNGSAMSPYCAPNDAVSHLGGPASVIIIVGAANSQMTLNTTSVSPVVIGRKDLANNVGSIPAIASNAITVSSGTVLIRDLTVNAGTTSASKGIAISGSSTKLSLLRVTASLGTGVGIDAETGAELHMDRVLVQSNSAGGILINGAKYEIINSIIANNNYGVQFSATATPSSGGMAFAFDTVVGNTGNATTCDPGAPQTLEGSIVIGAVANCTLDHTVTIAPPFDSTDPARPYHLAAKLACPGGDPSTFPPDDFDGDGRAKPLDCGADQFVVTP